MQTVNTSNPTLSMRFAWPWRPAQTRVLDTLEHHLADRKLHVVAPPGSGKTVLGLELFRRLGTPALALSPTRTIQSQWIRRLREFLGDGVGFPPAWASDTLDSPGYFTSVTYQALHTRFRQKRSREAEDPDAAVSAAPSEDDIRAIAERLRTLGVGTIILDEAHHLRRQWWKALSFLIEELRDVTAISLTATPPYDVLGPEWQRYEELCGTIDDEISVPELVRDGTLCPHQDYVWAVTPSETDSRSAREHDAAVLSLIEDLLRDEQLLDAIERHPWVTEERPTAEDVLDDPELACALLLYLQARHRPMPNGLLRLLALRQADLPTFDRSWWQLLLEAYIDERAWPLTAAAEDHRQHLLRRLRRDRLLWRRELRIEASQSVRTQLSLTSSKIDACVSVHRLEAAARGSRLRQVVLTDYIDDEALDSASCEPRRLGACPVFLALVRHSADSESVALITGRVAVLHESRVAALSHAIEEPIETEAIAALPSFVRVHVAQSTSLIGAFTRLLERGELRVLVATRSLLGEGWDAPCVNSLVLASFVGSFVLSNQMRGRALRVDRSSPKKAATIWHLAAVDPSTPSGYTDVLELERRFTAFVGLAANRPRIESGYARLDAPPLTGPEAIDRLNREMAGRFAEFESLAVAWSNAIEDAHTSRVLPTVVTKGPKTRPIVLARALQYLLTTAAAAFIAVWGDAMRALSQADDIRMVLYITIAAGIVGALLALPNLIRYAVLSWRHLPVDGSIRQIADAVREALVKGGLIGNESASTSLAVRQEPAGVFHISLASGTFREQALFADALEEVLGPIQNPRYLVTRSGVWWWRRKQDFHAVPQILGQQKELARQFLESWRHHVGPGELIFTRTPDGRRLLLQACARAFSRTFSRDAERLDEWH